MKKILIVDDDQNNLYLLKALLEESGYQVSLANEGQQALAKLNTEHIDLIISDILMPVMDGFLLCHQCHKNEKFREIPFVFYTATYTDAKDEELAGKLGAVAFIKKPLDPDDFIKIIENVIKAGQPKPVEVSASEIAEEEEILKLYSESLINKLEQKNIDLTREMAERRKTEAALIVSERSFKTIFEQAAIGVAQIDSQTMEFIKVNQRYCDILGYNLEELTRLTFADITHPDDLQISLDNLTRLKTGEIRELLLEKRYLRKDGEIVWVNLTVSPLWNPGEKPTTHISTVQDITAQKLAEQELRNSERHLRTVLENEPECVKLLGLNGELLEMNPAGLAMIEADSLEQVRGQRMLNIVAPKWRNAFAALTKNVLNGATETLEFEVIGLKGTRRWLETNATPLRNEAGEVISLLGITREITERKRSEGALQKSEERLWMLFEQMIDGFYYSTADGKLLDINPAMVKMFGYSSKEEMLKVDIVRDLYIHPDDRKSWALAEGKQVTEVYPMRRKDGSVIWVEDSGRYIYDDDGNVEFHEGLIRDVTERKLDRERLEQTNERLALSQQVGNIGSFEWDIPQNTNYWSPGMEALWGLETGEYTGDHEGWAKYVHPEDLAETEKEVNIALETGEIHSEYRIILPDKGVRWIQVQAKVFYDKEKNPLRMVGVNLDITERKESEKAIAGANVRAIREYENLLDILSTLAQTVGSARDINAIFQAVLDFTTNSVPCAALIISLKEENNTRKPIYFWYENAEHDVAELTDFPARKALVETALKTGEVVIVGDLSQYYDLPAVSQKPEQNLKSALIAPMKIKGDVIGMIEVQCFRADAFANEHITAMRMAANLVANAIENVRLLELEQQREEQLQRSQKLESVGRLAGGIAHDFNNMLTAINGYSELVIKRLKEDDPIRDFVVEIKKAGDRSAELTHQLLAFSRQQVLQLRLLNLNDIISDTRLLLGRLLGENLQLNTDLAPDLGLVNSDSGQLSQVIINLAVNARDAMPGGGVLTIKTSNIYFDEEFAESHIEMPTGSYILLSVSDSGVGMNKETLENIFEPFFTTKLIGKGTGLGLATVYGIVKQSNGHIFVDSRINGGTTFSIYLPRIYKEDQKPQTQYGTDKTLKGIETILVVEDEEMVRTLTEQVLQECGYKIIVAANGVEALSICDKLSHEIDLVLTDIVMPQMGGRELCEQLARRYPDLPVLFTSGYTDDANLSDYIIEEDVNFIAKPFTFDELSLKVRKYLDSRK